MMLPVFEPWPSIPRLSRDMVITEKLDGTNASIYIADDLELVLAGSRSRWLTPGQDNFGFAAWVERNKDELKKLGPGHHFGEWFGQGIQRGYGLSEKRFALFNTHRWHSPHNDHNDVNETSTVCNEVPICHVVPLLITHTFDTEVIDRTLDSLAIGGSRAAPGFMNPEGVVIYHTKADMMFKKTLDKNDNHKTNG